MPTDGSELAEQGVKHGLALAKQLQAKVTVVTVSEPWTTYVNGEAAIAFPMEEFEKSAAEQAASVLDHAKGLATAAGTSCETVYIKDQFVADGIIKAAEDGGCDLIVMSSHGRRGLSRLLLGSQATGVLTHSKIPVLIYR